jgi:hypothetical protein
MARTKRNAKAADKDKLKGRREVVLKFEATEEFLQRLAALLIFAPPLVEAALTEPLGPLPWEDPENPTEPPALAIDLNAVRNAVLDHLKVYIERHGKPKAKTFVHEFTGGKKLPDVPEKELLMLEEALRLALKLDGPDAKP